MRGRPGAMEFPTAPPVHRTYDRCMNGSNGVLTSRHPGWRLLAAAGFSAARIDAVLGFYDEPHRVYHDRRHLRRMLDDAARHSIILSPAQALAVLFHDAVHVPGVAHGANEALSAQLLRIYSQDLEEATVRLASSIVIDTAQHEPSSAAAATVLDLDLLRLSAPVDEFNRSSHDVFAEMRPLFQAAEDCAWRLFTARQALFFERLLARPRIYSSPLIFDRCEAAARANLHAAIERQRTG